MMVIGRLLLPCTSSPSGPGASAAAERTGLNQCCNVSAAPIPPINSRTVAPKMTVQGVMRVFTELTAKVFSAKSTPNPIPLATGGSDSRILLCAGRFANEHSRPSSTAASARVMAVRLLAAVTGGWPLDVSKSIVYDIIRSEQNDP